MNLKSLLLKNRKLIHDGYYVDPPVAEISNDLHVEIQNETLFDTELWRLTRMQSNIIWFSIS